MSGPDTPDTDDEAALERLRRRLADLQNKSSQPAPSPSPGPQADRGSKSPDGGTPGGRGRDGKA
ncbi:hypothetical protein [Phreatobacter sp.]|uniref:hypothetical protein n=1 Tax=Phreatobacter sp. TaxID=1966341 RepID=UPI003F6E586D